MNYRYGEQERVYDYETLVRMNKKLCRDIIRLENSNERLSHHLDDAQEKKCRIDIVRNLDTLEIDVHGFAGEIYINGQFKGEKVASSHWFIRWKIEGIRSMDYYRQAVNEYFKNQRPESGVFEVDNKLGG